MPHALSLFLKKRWPLLMVLLIFICFKLPQLHFPFYIDEGMVYAPAVKLMAIHGPSLLPGSISSEFSRGHPLLFHFLCALWMNCFGSSNVAVHSFALAVSVTFLIVLFECCMRLFNRKVAILVLLLVASRVIFFVQSSFVYPEVMLAALAFLSLYFYCRDHLLLCSLVLCMLFFTKEGGLIFGAVIGADAVVSLFRKQEKLSMRILRLVSIILPVCLIGLFFALQHAKEGWYILPEHTDLIKPDWNAYYIMFKSALYWGYRGDLAMGVLVFFIIILSIIPALKYKNIGYLFLIPPAVVVYAQAEMFPDRAAGSIIWTALYLVCFTVPVYGLLQLDKTLSAPARKFITLMAISVVAFLFYSSVTQIAYRYLLVNIVLVLIFLALCISAYIHTAGQKLFCIAAAGIILIGAYGFYSNDRAEDTQLGSFRLMNVQQHGVSYLEKENAFGKEIVYNCAWGRLHYTDTVEGYLSSGKVFTHIGGLPVTPNTVYAVFDREYERAAYEQMLHNPDFHLVYKITDGDAWTVIFKRNK